MKHVHCDKIVAKAENMDLVLFNKSEGQDCWNVSHETCLPVFSTCEYFLCLPQHEEACLHWLNGGEIQERGFYNTDAFGDITMIGNPSWNVNHIFMDATSEFRIKPKKEKRWVIVNPAGKSVKANLMKASPDISEYPEGCQSVEIEVEV